MTQIDKDVQFAVKRVSIFFGSLSTRKFALVELIHYICSFVAKPFSPSNSNLQSVLETPAESKVKKGKNKFACHSAFLTSVVFLQGIWLISSMDEMYILLNEICSRPHH